MHDSRRGFLGRLLALGSVATAATVVSSESKDSPGIDAAHLEAIQPAAAQREAYVKGHETEDLTYERFFGNRIWTDTAIRYPPLFIRHLPLFITKTGV